jgi:S1-C subfamily serine protease
VLALGSPLGLEFSVTSGIVSALHRSGGPENNISDFIQTDASINQGNSGGALVNIRGEVVGINTWIASPSGGNVGLGFSVPIDNAKKVISDLIDKKSVRYGWLGVSLVGLDDKNAEELSVKGRKGAFVGNVFIDSPASRGGFLPGDFVIEADGKKVDDTRALTRFVGDMPAGKDFKFKIVRLGKEMTITVRIGERDEKTATDNSRLWPGLDLLSLKSEDLDQKKLEGKTGLFVAGVQAKSPAQAAGIKAGDLLLKVNGKVVGNLIDFYRLLNEPGASKFTFTYERDGSEFETAAYTKK